MACPTRVQLFATCLIEALRPEAGLAVVDVLERLGLAVECLDGKTCCGQPAFNAGDWQNARAMARHTVELLSDSDAPIVVPSGSCADMIRHHFAELLDGDSTYGPMATSVAGRTFGFTQFLVAECGATDLGAHHAGRVGLPPIVSPAARPGNRLGRAPIARQR